MFPHLPSLRPQLVAVWWSAAVGEIQPWTPSGRDQDRANVLVYRLTAPGQQPAGAAPGDTPTGSAPLSTLEQGY